MNGMTTVYNRDGFTRRDPHVQYFIIDRSKKKQTALSAGGSARILMPVFSSKGPDNELFSGVTYPVALEMFGSENIRKYGYMLTTAYKGLKAGALGNMCRLTDAAAGYALKYAMLALNPVDGSETEDPTMGIGVDAKGNLVATTNESSVVTIGTSSIPSKLLFSMYFKNTNAGLFNPNDRCIKSQGEMETEAGVMTNFYSAPDNVYEKFAMWAPSFCMYSRGRGRYGNKTAFILNPSTNTLDSKTVHYLSELNEGDLVGSYNVLLEEDFFYDAVPYSIEDKLVDEGALYLSVKRFDIMDRTINKFISILETLLESVETGMEALNPGSSESLLASTALINLQSKVQAIIDHITENDISMFSLFDFTTSKMLDKYAAISEWIGVDTSTFFGEKISLSGGCEGAFELYKQYNGSSIPTDQVAVNQSTDHVITYDDYLALASDTTEYDVDGNVTVLGRDSFEVYNPYIKCLSDFFGLVSVPSIADMSVNRADIVIDADYPSACKMDIVNFCKHTTGRRGDITYLFNLPTSIDSVTAIKNISLASYSIANTSVCKFAENAKWIDYTNKPRIVPMTMLVQDVIIDWFNNGMSGPIAGNTFGGPVKGSIRPLISSGADKSDLAALDFNLILDMDGQYTIFGQQTSYNGYDMRSKELHNQLLMGRINKDAHFACMSVLHMLTSDVSVAEAEKIIRERLEKYGANLDGAPEVRLEFLDRIAGDVKCYIDVKMYGTIKRIALEFNIYSEAQ